MDRNDVAHRIPSDSPDSLKENPARKHLSWMPQQLAKQKKLVPGEVRRLAADEGDAMLIVKRDRSGAQEGGLRFMNAAGKRINLQPQLGYLRWLSVVIIYMRAERLDSLSQTSSLAEHHEAAAHAAATQFSAKAQAVQTGQRPFCDDYGIGLVLDESECFLGRRAVIHVESDRIEGAVQLQSCRPVTVDG